MLLDFSNHLISKNLVKNNYTAQSIMKDDINKIDTAPVVENGGGVQVINKDYKIILSQGLDTFNKDYLTISEFTDFLVSSKSKGIPYSYSIEYNANEEFWLIVTFPVSIRIDFAIVHNKDFTSVDKKNVIDIIVAIIMFYLILLAISTMIYSKLTSISIVNPLRKLYNTAKLLRDGDYSTRVNLNLKNEFGELEDIFNSMAQQIEKEISLRKQSEDNRKRLILDISHDLKNPLSSIMGYTELYLNNEDLTLEEGKSYIRIIHENSLRANSLINSLFELSKLESSDFVLAKTKIDICEYLREEMINAIPIFDEANFTYNFNIPEKEIFLMLDIEQMNRVFQNLITNTVQYNPDGTNVTVSLLDQEDEIIVIFKDDGIGIPQEIAQDIFLPFVRVDLSRNSQTGGTGLGLSIVEKIIKAHDGEIRLITDKNLGCEFIIALPKI